MAGFAILGTTEPNFYSGSATGTHGMNDIGIDKKQQLYIIKKMINIAIRATYYTFCSRRSQSIEIDIGNQSISIADCYRLILVIENNRTHRKKLIDFHRLAKIDNSR